MFDWVLLLAGVLLEVLILYRAARERLAPRYPLFYSYIGCVLLVDLGRDLAYFSHLGSYRNLYFATEFLTLLVGYGVVLEVTRKSFEAYAGAERFSRYLVVATFVAIFSYVGLKALTAADWSPVGSLRELERDLRAVQAAVMVGVLAIIVYYGIQIGRNLGGVILGYGFYTASAVSALALRSYGGTRAFAATLLLQRYSYLVCLLMWVVALWSYHPSPAPDTALRFEADYEGLVGRTRGMLGTMRSLLVRSARP